MYTGLQIWFRITSLAQGIPELLFCYLQEIYTRIDSCVSFTETLETFDLTSNIIKYDYCTFFGPWIQGDNNDNVHKNSLKVSESCQIWPNKSISFSLIY